MFRLTTFNLKDHRYIFDLEEARLLKIINFVNFSREFGEKHYQLNIFDENTILLLKLKFNNNLQEIYE